MQDLVHNNFYCIAPDMRGYSEGARPKGKVNYQLQHLTTDIFSIAKSLSINRFHLIGHDWGALVGWVMTHNSPDVVLSWTALSVPHPQAFKEAMKEDVEQAKMSRYIKFFQFPWIPEWQLRKNDFYIFRRFWKHSSEEELEDYLKVFRGKYALTASLNYYRGNFRLFRSSPVLGEVKTPTLFIWGEDDRAVGPTGVENGHAYMKGPYKFLPLKTGHWIIQTKYLQVYSAILAHLQANQ